MFIAVQASATAVAGSAPVSMTSFSALPKVPQKLSNCSFCGRGRPAAAASAKPWVIGSVIVTVGLAGHVAGVVDEDLHRLGRRQRERDVDGELACSGSRFGLMYQPSVPVNGLAAAVGAGRDRRDGELVAEGRPEVARSATGRR